MTGSPEYRLAAADIAWNPRKRREEIAVFGEMIRKGVDGLEIAGTKLYDDPTTEPNDVIRAYGNFCREQGIKPVAVTSLFFGRPELQLFDRRSRAGMEAHLRKMMHFAELLGAKTLVFGSPKNRIIPEGMGQVEADDIARDFLFNVGEAAQQHDVTFVLEPVHPSYGTNFATTTEDALRLVERVGHPNVGLHFDTATAMLNGEIPNIKNLLIRAKPYLRHVHVSHPGLSAIHIGRDPLSVERASQHRAVAGALKEIDYHAPDRYISLEMVSNNPAKNVQAVRKGVAALQRFYGR